MRRVLLSCVLVLIVLVSSGAWAGSGLKSGTIDSSSGVPDKDLKYEDFQITDDGFITGCIVNSSGKVRPAVRLDLWTTNKSETRILWRKSLALGDIGPHEKKQVKEPYKEDTEEPSRTEIKFRLPSGANYRNK